MKKYTIQYNVGSAKYVVNYHNGEKKHPDGIDFYDIALFNNKVRFNQFTKNLQKQGYKLI